MEIKKPYVVVQYNKFMKGVERADRYLSFYSVLRKTVKCSKKVVLYLLKRALLNAFFVYRTLNRNKKVKYKNLLHEVKGPGYQKSRIEVSLILMIFNCQRSKHHHGGLNTTRQADSPVISKYTNLKKFMVVGREKRSILQDSVKCVLHIRSELQLDIFVNCSAPQRDLF